MDMNMYFQFHVAESPRWCIPSLIIFLFKALEWRTIIKIVLLSIKWLSTSNSQYHLFIIHTFYFVSIALCLSHNATAVSALRDLSVDRLTLLSCTYFTSNSLVSFSFLTENITEDTNYMTWDRNVFRSFFIDKSLCI